MKNKSIKNPVGIDPTQKVSNLNPTESMLKSWYEFYERQYDKSAKHAAKYGETPKIKKSTYKQFKTDYLEAASDRADKGEKYMSPVRLSEDIAKRQVRATSYKAAKGLAKYYAPGKAITPDDIYRYMYADRQIIDADIVRRANELKRAGENSPSIALTISQEFFGS